MDFLLSVLWIWAFLSLLIIISLITSILETMPSSKMRYKISPFYDDSLRKYFFIPYYKCKIGWQKIPLSEYEQYVLCDSQEDAKAIIDNVKEAGGIIKWLDSIERKDPPTIEISG